jgi:metallopeptidase MepB
MRNYPATVLVCNFINPTPTKPSLLKHTEIVTLFHELGHGIHDLVAKTIYSRFHGTSVVWDFVEAPSQMLENWCWTPSQLKSLSNHYETGEKISDGMISKLIEARSINSTFRNLDKLYKSIFDMTINTPKSHEEAMSINIPELYNSLREEILGHSGPELPRQVHPLSKHHSLAQLTVLYSSWGHGYANMKHLASGYDAGYYVYLFSQVFAADMWNSGFAEDPMNGSEGRRYRHMVLEKGGSQDEMAMLEEYLGQKPSSEAFYCELNL